VQLNNKTINELLRKKLPKPLISKIGSAMSFPGIPGIVSVWQQTVLFCFGSQRWFSAVVNYHMLNKENMSNQSTPMV
jgi:hypothetical protein